MTADRLQKTERTEFRRRTTRGSHERRVIDSILDAGRVCHVAWVEEGRPVVLPTAYARDGDHLLLHGASKGRFLTSIADGRELCVTVTHLDGLVLARSTFHSSMNYRSVVIFGRGEVVEEREAKIAALDRLVEHLVPGRSREARGANEAELSATLVVRVPIAEGSAKVRRGGPIDAPGDLELPIWAGVVPLERGWGAAVAAEGAEQLETPASVVRLGDETP